MAATALLDAGADIRCPHGGIISSEPTSARVLLGGHRALTTLDRFSVIGCPLPQPCLTVEWRPSDVGVVIDGRPALLLTSTGTCVASNGGPQGEPVIHRSQTAVLAQSSATGLSRQAFNADRALLSRLDPPIPGERATPSITENAPGVRFAVRRPRDLLVLDVEALGMRLQVAGDDGPRLVVEDGQTGARLVVGFPPQHLGEQAALESDPTPPRDELADVRFARFSRLVFAVAPGEAISFSSEGVLAAMRRLPLVVVPLATARSDEPPDSADLTGQLDLPGGLVLADSAKGPVLSEGGPEMSPLGPIAAVNDLLRGSAALRAARVRLEQQTAVDIRGIDSQSIVAGIAERPLLGPDGLVVPESFSSPQRTVPARAPRADETAIEAPWRLILSPSVLGGFAHSDTPVGPTDPVGLLEPAAARERIELWHSRLAMRHEVATPDGAKIVSVDERADRRRIVRAIWARERERSEEPPKDWDVGPFRASLRPWQRWQLVLQSAETLSHRLGDVAPEPIDVKALALSALGAWVDVHGGWEATRYEERGSTPAIKSWDHVAPMGRDQFVQVVTVGFLYPLGHQAVLVQQTERKIRTAIDPVARLYQRFFIVVAEPERTHGVLDLPFTAVRFLTLVTPKLREPPVGAALFWPALPNGQDVIFSVETIDHEGRHARLQMPLLFLNAAEVLQPTSTVAAADAMYRPDPRAEVAGEGQRMAFAQCLRPGDTSAEVRSLRLDATLEGQTGVGAGRRLQPRLRAAEIVPATSRLLTPDPETFHANYHPAYAANGFPKAAGDPANAADLFLQVVDSAQLTTPVIAPATTLPKVSFGSTERSGGFVDPSQQIAGLTRRLGTVGDVGGALAGTFDPAKLLDGMPKLFGLFRLRDVLGSLGLEDAPTFITEALGPIQGLLADFAALQAAVQRAAAQAAELQAYADKLATSLSALTGALGPLMSSKGKLEADVIGGQIQALLSAFTATVTALTPLVATLPLSPVDRSELDKLLSGVQPYVADAAKIMDAVSQVLALIQGLDPANLEVRAKLEWTTPIKEFRIDGHVVFEARKPLRISVESRGGAKTGASFNAAAELTDFSLTLVPPAALMRMNFDRLAFRAGSSGKPDVDVVFGGIEFIGPLSFVETLKELIPLDGFSDPPFLDVSASGVRAGFSLGLPNVAVGVFALQNVSLGADCNVPFLGESLSVGFNFCTRDRPFALTVTFIGGGGFLGVRISPQGLELLELAIEAGARLAVDLGVASGSIEAMLGIYLRLEGKGGSLAGYFRLRGEVDVLGLISASIELSLELVYEFDTGKMVGRATIKIEVEVFMFSFSVSVAAERRFAGSNGDPTFGQAMELAADGSSRRWDEYCDAFA